MKFRIMLVFFTILSVSALHSESLDVEFLISADLEAKEANRVWEDGQTIKAKKMEKAVAARLTKYFKSGRRYTLPDECQFTYRLTITFQGAAGQECVLSKVLSMSVDQKDKAMLEKLEECTNEPCTGEFVLVPDYEKKLFSLWMYQYPTIWVTAKFLSVKPVSKKPEQ